MKKLLVVLVSLLLIALFTNGAMAAQEQTVTVNPLGLMFGIFNAQYEKPLGNQDSFLVSGEFLHWKFVGLDPVTGFGVGGGYRKYLGDKEFEGFFAQGTGNVAFVKAGDLSSTLFGVSGMAGFKWIFDHGFTLEAGAGGQFKFGGTNLTGYTVGGFGPALAFSLGYTW